MTFAVWRIAAETPAYTADDLSGKGAKQTGGRWNSKGMPLIYASTTIAMACLETLVHLNAGGLPLNRYLVRIELPDEVWARRQTTAPTSLAVGWDAVPHGRTSIDMGDGWIAGGSTLLLEIPSVIVPEETNVLINPKHPDIAAVTAIKVRRWTYDPRAH